MRLLPYTKAAEYLPQQVVGTVFPRDGSEGFLGQPQFLSKQLMAFPVLFGTFQVRVCLPQGLHMAFASHE
jgi:hypothetical protein